MPLLCDHKATQIGDVVALSGDLDESAKPILDNILKTAAKHCTFVFRDLHRTNSSGIANWLAFVDAFQMDRDFEFCECSPEIVMQMNMIPKFKGTAKVVSVYGVLSCEACGAKSQMLFERGRNLPPADIVSGRCQSCGGNTVLSEFEDVYFKFCKD